MSILHSTFLAQHLSKGIYHKLRLFRFARLAMSHSSGRGLAKVKDSGLQSYLGILQGNLVAGGFVVEPLGRLGVDVSQE